MLSPKNMQTRISTEQNQGNQMRYPRPGYTNAQFQGGVSFPDLVWKQNTPLLGHQYYTDVSRLGSQRINLLQPRS